MPPFAAFYSHHHLTAFLESSTMVHLDVVRACNTALLKSQPFVAVFFGGTAGIGECGVRSLASTHGSEGKGLRLYIVGRNKAAAERTIAHCLEICPTGTFQFVQAKDLSLMRDVDRVCAEIISEERKANGEKAKIDFLCLSQGFLSFKSRRGRLASQIALVLR